MSNYKFYNNIFAKVDPIEQTQPTFWEGILDQALLKRRVTDGMAVLGESLSSN